MRLEQLKNWKVRLSILIYVVASFSSTKLIRQDMCNHIIYFKFNINICDYELASVISSYDMPFFGQSYYVNKTSYSFIPLETGFVILKLNVICTLSDRSTNHLGIMFDGWKITWVF